MTLLSGEKEDFGGVGGGCNFRPPLPPVSAGVRKELNGAESISRSGGGVRSRPEEGGGGISPNFLCFLGGKSGSENLNFADAPSCLLEGEHF